MILENALRAPLTMDPIHLISALFLTLVDSWLSSTAVPVYETSIAPMFDSVHDGKSSGLLRSLLLYLAVGMQWFKLWSSFRKQTHFHFS